MRGQEVEQNWSLEGSGGGAQLLAGGVRRWRTAARWRGPVRGQKVEQNWSLERSGGGAQLLAEGVPGGVRR